MWWHTPVTPAGVEAGGSQVPGQPGLHSGVLKTKNNSMTDLEDWGVPRWWVSCLACARPWAPSTALLGKKTKKSLKHLCLGDFAGT
jgi:hypothetical protein